MEKELESDSRALAAGKCARNRHYNRRFGGAAKAML